MIGLGQSESQRQPVLRVPKAANGASRRISEIAAEEWFLGKSPKNNC